MDIWHRHPYHLPSIIFDYYIILVTKREGIKISAVSKDFPYYMRIVAILFSYIPCFKYNSEFFHLSKEIITISGHHLVPAHLGTFLLKQADKVVS